MSIESLYTFLTSDIKYSIESDGPTSSYRQYITTQLHNKYSMGLGSVFAGGKKVKTIQYLHISLAGYPISLGRSSWIRQISSEYSFSVTIDQPDGPNVWSEYLFGVSIGEPDSPSNIVSVVLLD